MKTISRIKETLDTNLFSPPAVSECAKHRKNMFDVIGKLF